MTDSRLPERYLTDRRLLRLTDTERSGYFMATLWSVANRTDGRIERDDMVLIPTFNSSCVSALVKAGLWVETDGAWLDTEFAKVQTSRDDLEVLDNARRADRDKKARHAAHKRGDHTRCYPEVCDQAGVSFAGTPGELPGELSRGGHRIGIGAGKGKDSEAFQNEENESVNPATGEVSWPIVSIPGGVVATPLQKPTGSTLCRVCNLPLHPAVAASGVHPNCEAAA